MFIYKTTNLVNGKIYIGQHIGNRKSYLGSGHALQQAIKKYGKKNFSRVILENCETQKELDLAEIKWIAKYDSTNRSIGYNIEHGGNGKGKVNEESKKLMSIAKRNPTPETREKLRKARLGKSLSEETKEKLRKANTGKKYGPMKKWQKDYFSKLYKGKVVSEETKKRMSESGKEKVFSKTHKLNLSKSQKGKRLGYIFINDGTNVKCIDKSNWHKYKSEGWKRGKEIHKTMWISKDGQLKKVPIHKVDYFFADGWIKGKASKIKVTQLTLDGLKVKTWKSATDAAKFGFFSNLITKCCKGKQKTHKGFKWMYLHEYEKGLNND